MQIYVAAPLSKNGEADLLELFFFSGIAPLCAAVAAPRYAMENMISEAANCGPNNDKNPSGFTYNGVPVESMLAYPLGLAAKLLGVSYTTLWKWVRQGKIRQHRAKLISRAELQRFLAEYQPVEELNK